MIPPTMYMNVLESLMIYFSPNLEWNSSIHYNICYKELHL